MSGVEPYDENSVGVMKALCFSAALAAVSTLSAAGLWPEHASAAADQPTPPTVAAALKPILTGSHRSASHRARDVYRHPVETLAFFDVKPEQRLVEVWPGGGWYTELLAPLVRERGEYFAAGFALSMEQTPQMRRQFQHDFLKKLQQDPQHYDHVVVTELLAPERATIAPPGSVDRVLTFRNVHNWLKDGNDEAMFRAFFRALKPGGLLGVTEHRAAPGTTVATMKDSGYVTEAHVIALAEKAGFRLLARSEINANPNDKKQYPDGVWSLPPVLRTCKQVASAKRDACETPYRRIGESDRMTLKFVKPSTRVAGQRE